MDEVRYEGLNRTLDIVNRMITTGFRLLGGLVFLGCVVVWAATPEHIYNPYIAGGALGTMGVSAVAGAWTDLRAAKNTGLDAGASPPPPDPAAPGPGA